MKDGFIKVCAATPDISVADCKRNTDAILRCVRDAAKEGAKVCVLPELCVTGYTCADLFFQNALLKSAEEQLLRIAEETKGLDMLIAAGAPVMVEQKLYNCAVVFHRGRIQGIIPKIHLPNYSEFMEARYFMPGERAYRMINFHGQAVPFGANILFADKNVRGFVFAAEVCEDLWSITPPSNYHAQAGATVIANLSASNELVGKEQYREQLITMQSAKLNAAYLYASAGEGESTMDLVFSSDNLVAEDGTILSRSKRFANECVYAEIDLERLVYERRRITSFQNSGTADYFICSIAFDQTETVLTRQYPRMPFVPAAEQDTRLEEILMIQALGLKKRLSHTRAETAVIGVSGGLDSTLALLVTARAFDMLGWDKKNILAVTMPCFGTTDRTYQNALHMAQSLGTSLREVNIADATLQHFKDIGHDPKKLDVTFENAQARERTQVLMDIANQENGLVVGTGDLSELALGWATYNGDHMSMYGVNAGVPKTLIRYLVQYEAERTDNQVLQKTLADILATPVSPELLPPEDGEISQKTESIVGPYELHDFFLYYMLRCGFRPGKILRIAERAFAGTYDRAFILGWLKVFYRRFFQQQFKRSCLPDGPKVGSVALSPRGDWRMPSDASSQTWLEEIEELEKR